MLLTSQNTIISIFTEEITNFFDDKNVLFTPDLGFNGKSGNQQTFEFVIPHFKNKKEKIIKAVNTPTTKNYINYVFPFVDIREVRRNSNFIIIANDLNTSISDKFYSPFANYGIDVLAWSKREEWYEKLKVV